MSKRSSNQRVYNPMTGDRAYLSSPLGLYPNCYYHTYILLTTADGIGCSFLMLATEVGLYNKNSGCRITFQMVKSSEASGTS